MLRECVWEFREAERHCPVCNRSLPYRIVPRETKAHRECLVNGGKCDYLGEQTSTRSCPTCTGNVRLKVFACSHPLHRETTLPECATCRDFKAS